jgi:hypothetical protein
MEDYPGTIPNHSANEDLFVETLAALPEKPQSRRRKDTSYGLVLKHYEPLKQARKKGYSYEDLAALIESRLGRKITNGTLRKYMNRAAKEKATGGESIIESTQELPAPVSKPVRKSPEDTGRFRTHRPTLHTHNPDTRASEDEFENL